MKKSISVVLLAYKEAENLKILLPKIKKVIDEIGCDYEILIVDSATPLDDSPTVSKEFGAAYYPQEAPGYSGAFKTGVKYATKDIFLMLDADGSHDPKYIPILYQLFIGGKYDVVIGSRYQKGGKSNDSRSSYLMSLLLNLVMRICIGIPAKDISISYRMYDRKNLQSVPLIRNNYDVLQEVLLRLKIQKTKQGGKFNIGEIPIIFQKRMAGESKRQLWKFIKGYIASVFILFGLRVKAMFSKTN